jgi:hypothetical protein
MNILAFMLIIINNLQLSLCCDLLLHIPEHILSLDFWLLPVVYHHAESALGKFIVSSGLIYILHNFILILIFRV